MDRSIKQRKRWPKGTWMRLISPDTLKALMDQKGFTGARLARASGKSGAFISQLRNGVRRSCKADTAKHIAEALDVPLTLLFDPQLPSSETRTVKREVAA